MERPHQLRAICQAGKEADPGWYRIHRRLSIYLTWALLHTRVAPTPITLGMMAVALVGAALLAVEPLGWNLAGFALLYVAFLLDKCDGEVARYRGVASPRGVMLDRLHHLVIEPAIVFAAAWREYQATGGAGILVIGMLAIIVGNVIEEQTHWSAYALIKHLRGAGRFPEPPAGGRSIWARIYPAFRALKAFRMFIVVMPTLAAAYLAQAATGAPVVAAYLAAMLAALAVYLVFQSIYYHRHKLDDEIESYRPLIREQPSNPHERARDLRSLELASNPDQGSEHRTDQGWSQEQVMRSTDLRFAQATRRHGTGTSARNASLGAGGAAIVLTLVLGLGAVTGASAATYYVDQTSPSCSGSGPGTEAQPYCTIQQAVTARGTAGNTILVKPGLYREQVTVAASGTAGSPIVIQATGPGVIVDGSDDFGSTSLWAATATPDIYVAASVTSAPTGVWADGQWLFQSSAAVTALPSRTWRYVSGQGLYVNAGGGNPGSHQTLVGRRNYGFRLDRRSYVTVSGFEVRYHGSRNIYLTGPLNDTVIEDNSLRFAGANGVAAVSCSAIVIRDNFVADHLDHGINFTDTKNSVIEDNEATRNARPNTRAANGFYLSGSSNNLIQRNYFHRNQDSGMNFTNDAEFNICLQNIYSLNGDHGVDHLDAGSGNVSIGDVAYRNFKDGFSIEGSSPNHAVYNCIGFENGLQWEVEKRWDLFVDPPSSVGYQGDYNIWYKTDPTAEPIKFGGVKYMTAAAFAAATGHDTHGLTADPMFADTAAGNFRLLDASPAIDNGTSSVPFWPATDFDGRARIDDPVTPNTGAGPTPFTDRGAFEFVPNTPPVAVLSVDPASGIGPLPVIASGAGSTDEGSIVSYRFDFGDGVVVGPQASPTANHTYAIGEWVTTLTVTDNRGGVDTMAVPVVVSANLIGNPSFETNTTGWGATSGATLARVAGGQDGSFAAQVTGPASPATFELNDTPDWIGNAGAINTRYRFTAWVRSLTHTGKAHLRIREFNATILQRTSTGTQITLSPTWQLLSVDHLTAAVGSNLDYRVIFTPNVAGEVVLVDNLTARIVTLDRAPIVTAPPTAVVAENAQVTIPVTAFDPDGEAMGLTADLSGLPLGHNAVFTPAGDNLSGTLTWTPTFFDERPEPYLVIFRAANTLIGADTTAITVTAIDPPPVVDAGPPLTTPEGVPISIGITAFDPDSSGISNLTADLTGLPAGHNATFTPGPGNRTGVLSWTPSFSHAGGPYPVVFIATNSLVGRDTALITVTNVDQAPALDAPATAIAGEATLFTLGITAVDGDGQPVTSLTADLSGLPPGHNAVFTPAAGNGSGTLTWTPPAGTPPGPYPVVFIAANVLTGRDTTLVTVNRAPVVTAPATAGVGELNLLSVNVGAADVDGDPITLLTADLSALPAGHNAVFTPGPNNLTGTLTWTPTAADGRIAPYAVTFTATTAAANLSASATTLITVDQPPDIGVAAAVVVGEGEPLTLNLTAADPDGQAITSLSANLSALPGGHNAQFTPGAGNTTGTLTWTPTFADGRVGPYVVTFTAQNALSGVASTAITVDQHPVVTAPVAESGLENAPLSVAVSAVDPDGQALASFSADLSALPAGHNAVFTPGAGNTTGTLTWTPTFSDSGTYVVTFIAANDRNGSAQTTLRVGNVDRNPVLTAAANVTASETDLLTLPITVVDPDGDAITTLTANLTGLPPGHDAVFTPGPGNASGTLTWTPTIDDGGGAPYTVVFDAANVLPAQATTVIAVDQHPIVTAQATASVAENQLLTINVTATDPDGQPIDSLTADVSALPPGASYTFTPNGSHTAGVFTWTPSFFDAPGPHTVTFVAWNRITGSAATAVTVINHDRPPIMDCPAYVIGGERQVLTLNVTAIDPDGEPITSLIADVAGLPPGHNASFTPGPNNNTGTLTWTPALGDGGAGPYVITFLATNALTAANATAVVVDRAPVVTVDPAPSVIETSTLILNVSVADADGDPISSLVADLSALPAGHDAVFTQNANHTSGTLTWTPTYNDAPGPYAITFIAANALADTAGSTVAVVGLDRPPVVTVPASTVGGESAMLSFVVQAADPEGDPISSLTADLSGLPAVNDAVFTPALDNLSGTFTWTPQPADAPGPYTVTFIATANSVADSADVAIAIDRHPVVTAPVSLSQGEGTLISLPITVVDPDGQPITSLTADLSGLPAGHDAVFTPGAGNTSGTLTWTPDYDDAGTMYPVSFTASNDLSGLATTQITITNTDRAPVVVAPEATLVAENAPLTVQVRAMDPDGDPITGFVADFSSLPFGHNAIFTPGPGDTTGTMTWTPTLADGRLAPYPVAFIASNALSGSDTTAVTVDQRPEITVAASFTFGEGTPITVNVTASDPDGQPISSLTANLSGLPAGHNAVFTPAPGNGSGTLTWTPTYNDSRPAPYFVTFTATNALIGAGTTGIRIDNTDRAPVVAAPPSVSSVGNTPIVIDVTAGDPDLEAIGSISADLSVLPAGHNAVFTPGAGNTSGRLTWTPTVNDPRGPYALVFTAANALSGNDTTVVTIDQAPVVTVAPTASVNENQLLTVNVTVADLDGDAISSLTANLSGLPAGHNAVFTPGAGNTSGTLTWTPSYDHAGGPYSVTFTAMNALTGNAATGITVINADRPPTVTAPATASGNEGGQITVAVTAVDLDGQPLTSLVADLSGLPLGHNAVFTPGAGWTSGTLTWTPDYDDAGGPYPVTFTAQNALSGQASTSITVGNTDRAPVVTTAPSANVNENNQLVLNITATDPDGQPITGLTADLGALPAGHNAVFTPGAGNTSGTLTWTPTFDDGRVPPYNVIFTAFNVLAGEGYTAVHVTDTNRAPVIGAPATHSSSENAPITINVTAVDPDGEAIGSLTADLTGLPAGHNASFTAAPNQASGTFTWTPSFSHAGGAYNVVFTALNSTTGAATTAITITNVDRAPTVTAPATASVIEGQPLTVLVSAADIDGESLSGLSASLAALPAGHNAVFTPGAGNTSGTLTWTPTAADVRANPYTVTFTAQNALSGNASTAITVLASNTPPVAALSLNPASGTVPLSVTADASGSTDNGSIVSYRFDFGDGTIVGPQAAPTALHTYGTAGGRLVTVIVTDNQGASDTASAVASAVVNLVTNPSFEANTSGWNANGSATIVRVAGGHHGSWCLEMRGSGTSRFGTNDSPNWVTNAGPAGTRYRFTAWVRSAAHQGNAQFRVREYLNGSLQGGTNYSPGVPLSTAWQLLSYEYVTLSSNSSIDFQVVDEPLVSGEIFQLDEVGIRPITTQPPVVVAPATVTVNEGQPVSFNVTVTDPDGDPITSLLANLSGLPPGHNATFTPGPGNTSGLFTWTPTFTDGRPAAYNVTFTASNEDVTVAGTAITVGNLDRAPVVTAPPTAGGTEGQPLAVNVTAADPDGEAIVSLTADLSGLPAGHNATFTPGAGNATGTLSWTPGPTHGGGPYTVTFTAQNALSGVSSTDLTIANVDQAPVVTAPANAAGTENQVFTLVITASDPDGQPIASLTANLGDLPAGHNATFVASGGNTVGTLTWTPATGDSALGPFDVSFTASNGLVGTANTRITLRSRDFAPQVTAPANVVVAENQPLTVNVTAVDPDGEPITSLTASLAGLPAGHGATFTPNGSNTAGTLTWTPTFADGGGPYTVVFTAANALTGFASTAISVTNVDRAPIATAPATASVVEGQQVTVEVAAADPDGEPITTLSASLGALPAGHNGVFTPGAGNTAGTLTWTPSAADVRANPYTVTFTAQNALSGNASTAITVLPSNVKPVAALTATPASGVAPLQVLLDASGSTDDGSIASYLFEFGDGGTAGPQAGATASHSYAQGIWNARVIVTDNQGAKDTADVVVDASETNLIANPGFETDISGWIPYSSAALSRVAGGHSGGFSIRVQGSSTSSFGIEESPRSITSIPAVGAVYRFSCWIRSDNSQRGVKIRIYEMNGTSQIGGTFYSPEVTLAPTWKLVTFDYTTRTLGAQIRMRITNYPSASNEVFFVDDVKAELVSTPPVPPIAALTVTPGSAVEPLTVTADASGSVDPGGSIASYFFDFGDGTTVGPQASPSAGHTYSGTGMWTVRVTVTDNGGATDSEERVVSAAPTAPGANLVANPGFETNTTGWSAQGTSTLTRVAGGHSGGFALQMRAGSSTTAQFGCQDNPNVVTTTAGVGRRYRFGAWVRSVAHTGLASIQVRELSGSTLRATTNSLQMRLSPEWQYLTVDHVVTVAGTTLDVRLLDTPNNTANETWLVDDIWIHLVPLGDQAPVVAAPGAESVMRNHPVTINVAAADPDGQAITSLTANLSGLPAGHNAMFTPGPGNTTGILTWTPTPADIRPTPYTVTFTAQNALSGSAATQITVTDSAVVVNLVSNPGFEADLSGWTNYGSAALSRVAGGHSGGFCVRVAGSSTSSFGIDDLPNTVPTVAAVGDVYRFSCWIRSDNTTRAVKIRIYELNGSSQVGSTFYSPEVTLAPTWKLVTVDYTTRQAGTALSMRVTDYPSASSEVFFVDDVSIEKLSGPSLVYAPKDATTEQITVAAAAAHALSSPRAFPVDGGASLDLDALPALWTLQIEGLDGPAFEGSLPRIVLARGDRTVTAAPERLRLGDDADGNGFEEVAATFTADDLHALLEGAAGAIEVMIEVNPGSPGALRFPLTLESSAAPLEFAASFTPNPMRNQGTLRFSLTRSGPVKVRIFDAQGRELSTLVDEPDARAGAFTVKLDGADGRTGRMPAGVYFYRIDAREGVLRGRFVLLK